MLPDSGGPIIEAEGLTRVYSGRTVVDIERLHVERGETLVVLGPSGSGKSVLLRMLNLLENPTAGIIRFNGVEVQDLEGRHRVETSRRMAMIFQDPLLFRGTVEQNVVYGLKVRGVPAGERDRHAGEILNLVGLDSLADEDVSTLSGGEAQRVSVARAMVLKPEALFLDEPFANLDAPTRRVLQEQLKGILRDKGMTAVFVTHDQEEAARLGDRILVLADGSIAQEGTARDIFYQPETEFVARFVGVDNLYRGEVLRSEGGLATVSVDGAVLEVVSYRGVGEEAMLGVRPEDVTLIPVDAVDVPSSSRNAFAGTVTALELNGPLVRVSVRCPFPLDALITRRSHEELGITVGDKVGVRFKATAVVDIEP